MFRRIWRKYLSSGFFIYPIKIPNVKESRIKVYFWETTHLPLPKPDINMTRNKIQTAVTNITHGLLLTLILTSRFGQNVRFGEG